MEKPAKSGESVPICPFCSSLVIKSGERYLCANCEKTFETPPLASRRSETPNKDDGGQPYVEFPDYDELD